MFVSEAMNRRPKTIEHNETIEKAVMLMKKNGISSLIVTKNRKPAGILTTFDIFSLDREKGKRFFVRHAMKTNLISVAPDDSLNYAASLMIRHKIQKLPVIEGEKIIGMLTASDMAEYQENLVRRVKNVSEIKKYMGVGS